MEHQTNKQNNQNAVNAILGNATAMLREQASIKHEHHRQNDIVDEPRAVCVLTFLSKANAIKCSWALGGVLLAGVVGALSWAAVTNHSIAVLETRQESFKEMQLQANNKLDVIISKIDNTRTVK
jgi:hypothetical protein